MKLKSIPLFSGTLLLFLFSAFNSSAQNYRAIELNQLLSSSNSPNNGVTATEVEEIRSLVYDLNPTVYITNSGIKTFGGEDPVHAEFNSSSSHILKSANPLFNSVALLKIKLSEKKSGDFPLNLSELKSFENLKYVFVECSYACSKSRIENMFTNVDDHIIVLYLIATPE